jgi:hypothetical protein
MKDKQLLITLLILIGLAFLISRPVGNPQRQALATPIASRMTITKPGNYTCNGGLVAGISITNTHDVTIEDCNVLSVGIAITDANYVTIRNFSVTNSGTQSGAVRINPSSNNGLVHDITLSGFHIYGNGNVGWGISGSSYPMQNITVRDGLIEDVGQTGGVQTHGMYISNWQGFLVEDVTILRSWNAGIKIVGTVNNGIFRRVTIIDSGRSGQGGGFMFGQSDGKLVTDNLLIEGCTIEGSPQPAIYLLDEVSNLTINHCFFKNNQRAVMVAYRSSGWTVTNNVGYNESKFSSFYPLYYGDAGDNNFFDYNNWYYDGQNPIRIGSDAISLAAWQDRGMDLHSISQMPITTDTPATPGSPTASRTATRTATMTPTRTATRTITPSKTTSPSSTPMRTQTPTATFTSTSTATLTPSPMERLCLKSVWLKQLKIRPDPSMYNVTRGLSIDPGAIIPIIEVVTNDEGTFGKVNWGMYAAMHLKSDGRTYAVMVECP